MTAVTCVHNISLELDCKECVKENKVYDKELLERGLLPPVRAELK